MKLIGYIGAILIAIIILMFVLEVIGLGFTKFFEPKRENIRREIFENTKSYVHGKIQDLSKYKQQYDKGTIDGKIAIEEIIKIQFADFDESTINVANLHFLINMRGY
jgi:hypothetical protein